MACEKRLQLTFRFYYWQSLYFDSIVHTATFDNENYNDDKVMSQFMSNDNENNNNDNNDQGWGVLTEGQGPAEPVHKQQQ